MEIASIVLDRNQRRSWQDSKASSQRMDRQIDRQIDGWMDFTSLSGGGSCPNIILHEPSLNCGSMYSGNPNVSLKNVSVGFLHMLTHMPVQLLAAKQRHLWMYTIDFWERLDTAPVAGSTVSTSTCSKDDGPTSQPKNGPANAGKKDKEFLENCRKYANK